MLFCCSRSVWSFVGSAASFIGDIQERKAIWKFLLYCVGGQQCDGRGPLRAMICCDVSNELLLYFFGNGDLSSRVMPCTGSCLLIKKSAVSRRDVGYNKSFQDTYPFHDSGVFQPRNPSANARRGSGRDSLIDASRRRRAQWSNTMNFAELYVDSMNGEGV